MNTCPKCGRENRERAQFCQACGTSLIQAPAPPTDTLDTKPLSHEPVAAPEPLPTGQQASDLDTKPLSPPDFAPLPPGALPADRRYEVVSTINKSRKLNAYLVRDRSRRHCPKCGSTINKASDGFCSECGGSLSDEPVEYPGYLLRETLDPDMLAQEALIAELGLRHKGLVNIHQAFEHQPYGPYPRFYVVSDPDEGAGLTTLPRPQPEEKVLSWGKQLAEALAYLHSHGVRHRNIRPENIRLVDSQAKLTNFNLAEKLPKAAPKEWPAEDVAALAQTLHALLAGQTMSPAVAAIFEKALSPNRQAQYPTAEALATDMTQVLEALRHPASVTFLVGRRSDVGRQRELNEDSLLTLEIERVLQSESKPVGLYAVADGMGGHSAGEVASALAINTLAHTVLTRVMLPVIEEPAQAEPDYGALLKEACLEANRAVYERGRKARSDMGTTLVAALAVGSEVYVANIGDSRAYRVSQRRIQQITTDHSVVERLVATGEITREQARTHPQRNLIYRTVGDKPQIEVDLFHERLKPDDWLVLCSDGLNGMVEDTRIQLAVTTALNPQAACEELVRLANEAGGDDNITVIVVRLEEVGSAG